MVASFLAICLSRMHCWWDGLFGPGPGYVVFFWVWVWEINKIMLFRACCLAQTSLTFSSGGGAPSLFAKQKEQSGGILPHYTGMLSTLIFFSLLFFDKYFDR